jgi:hypothetical protein
VKKQNRPISTKAKLTVLTCFQAGKRVGLSMLDTGAEMLITDSHQNCP